MPYTGPDLLNTIAVPTYTSPVPISTSQHHFIIHHCITHSLANWIFSLFTTHCINHAQFTWSSLDFFLQFNRVQNIGDLGENGDFSILDEEAESQHLPISRVKVLPAFLISYLSVKCIFLMQCHIWADR